MAVLLYIFCTTVPSHILSFALLWNFPWRSRKAGVALICFNFLCKMLLAGYYIANGMDFRNMELMFSFVGFLIYVFFVRVGFFKLLFTYLLIVDYLLVVRGIASFVSVRVFQSPSQGWQSSFLCICLYLLYVPVLLRFFRQVASLMYNTRASHLWKTVWLIPAILTGVTVLFTSAYLEDNAESWFFFACRISLLLCVFVICHTLIQTLENLQRQIAVEQQMNFERNLLEMQIEEQKKQTLLIVENAQQTRQLRHDLRHQLAAIQTMAGNGNPRLTEYLSSLIQDIPAAVTEYCENHVINAVVSRYASICQREGISLSTRLAVPAENPHMADSSLCVIFGNLLENAVEACGRMTEGKKFIHLNSRLDRGILTVTMDNSFSGAVHREKGRFRSSKREDFGVGLASIEAVARRHEGDARFETEGTVFHSLVYGKL